MATLPTTMKAIKIVEGHKAELQDVPLPQLRDDYVLIKVEAVALNPTDRKHIDKNGVPGSTVGCDVCGVIEEVGSKVTKGWKRGDRIATFTHGSNLSQFEDGCFAEYAVCKGDLGLKVPAALSPAEAATLPVGVITCGQALYQSLPIPLPSTNPKPQDEFILIYGGSTATGTLAIQYAILSGLKVLATASPHNHDLLTSLGAEKVFDYRDPDCGKKIREYTHDSLRFVLDCVAEHDSARICAEAMTSKGKEAGATIAYLLASAQHPREEDVAAKRPLGYTAIGEAFDKLGKHFPASAEDFAFCAEFWGVTQGLVEGGKLRTHPMRVGKGGLEGVFEGLEEMRSGRVSGVKLVYLVGDTPRGGKA